MKREWIRREGARRLTLFFCGWGMDGSVARDAAAGEDDDVLAFYDYREMEGEEAPETGGYEETRVVAWSMGVWAAAVLLERWGLVTGRRVAINGTERPVDERYGIHPRVYAVTERGMDERGREKFFARMCDGEPERERFEAVRPRREAREAREELRAIRERAAVERPATRWDRACVSARDAIFPAGCQRAWWKGRCEVVEIEGGHYPGKRFHELIGL